MKKMNEGSLYNFSIFPSFSDAHQGVSLGKRFRFLHHKLSINVSHASAIWTSQEWTISYPNFGQKNFRERESDDLASPHRGRVSRYRVLEVVTPSKRTSAWHADGSVLGRVHENDALRK